MSVGSASIEQFAFKRVHKDHVAHALVSFKELVVPVLQVLFSKAHHSKSGLSRSLEHDVLVRPVIVLNDDLDVLSGHW